MLARDSLSERPAPRGGAGDGDTLHPSETVARLLQEGAALASESDLAGAARRYADAVAAASARGDRAGYGRAMAQLASLEESCGEIDGAFAHNQLAQEAFLALGDGAGLVQTFRVESFLHLRTGNHKEAALSLARALGLALQLDGRLVMTTLNQIAPVARHLVEADQISALLPIGAALMQAVERAEVERLPDVKDLGELAATLAGALAPLGVMADEPELTAAQRRDLAARATHQAWLVDALTKRRWALAALVKETLQKKLDFQEELD